MFCFERNLSFFLYRKIVIFLRNDLASLSLIRGFTEKQRQRRFNFKQEAVLV